MTWGLFLSAAACVLGLAAAYRVARSPRLGRGSIGLALQLGAAAAGAGMLAWGNAAVPPAGWATILSAVLAAVTLSTAGGCLFTGQIAPGEREEGIDRLPLVLAITAPLLVGLWMLLDQPWLRPMSPAELYLPMGGWAHLFGVQLLLSAVIILQRLERAFRLREEHLRWQVKFPLLGSALLALSWIYFATKLLLYRGVAVAEVAFSGHALLVGAFSVLFGWRRLRDDMRLKFSHRAAYSMLTLSVVGIYLLLTSLLVAAVGSFANAGAEVVAFFFLFAVAVLAAVLLSAEARHRARDWIRRNLYLDRYDYRTAWIDADARIRSEHPAQSSAKALAEIVARSIDALHVTVWVHDEDGAGLRAAALFGKPEVEPGERSVEGEALLAAGRAETAVSSALEPAAAPARDFLERCHAVLYVPLVSAGEPVGLLTASGNLTNRPYSQETRDFLRVVGMHAARALHARRLRAHELEARESEAFREFALFLLHDLKNFASTLSLVGRNAAKHGDNPDFRRDAFESVVDTAEKMRRLCNTLRDFSVHPAAQRRPTDVDALVREVCGEIEGALPGHLVVETGGVGSCSVDPGALRSVVRNLVMNAAQALRDGKGSVRVSTSRTRDGCEIAVADDGVGIPAEFLAHDLFRPFRTTKSEGLGIGLFQARRAVEAHGGRIAVDSEEGAGATFTVQLPCPAPASRGPAPDDDAEPQAGADV